MSAAGMSTAKLKFNGKTVEIGQDITTLGRTSENHISFPDDPNVSRFHAEIEGRDGGFWLSDTGSSNGTTVNGTPARSDVPLKNGDLIVLGGSAEIEFETGEQKKEVNEPAKAAAASGTPSSAGGGLPSSSAGSGSDAKSGSGAGFLIAGAVACVLILLLAGGGVAYYLTRGTSCDARAAIISPDNRDTITAPTEIDLEIQNAECVGRVVFLADGKAFAASTEAPFSATLDPNQFPELADGVDHNISVQLFDEDGKALAGQASVMLAFDTSRIEKPEETEDSVIASDTNKPLASGPAAKEVSLVEINDMTQRLVKQFSGNFRYNVSDPQFLKEVQKRTAEYVKDGYFERAARYRDTINVAYVQEKNLDAALGFMLAMSRSKFVADKQGGDEGLWKMSDAFAVSLGFKGICGTETLSDASQACAARVSAAYMKELVLNVFEGDPIYGIAAFGKSPGEAVVWKSSLPANRTDVWKVIKTPREREQLIRFFAAGIVAENPEKFGLKKDRRISELYRLTM